LKYIQLQEDVSIPSIYELSLLDYTYVRLRGDGAKFKGRVAEC
jgi:hypothetical protein